MYKKSEIREKSGTHNINKNASNCLTTEITTRSIIVAFVCLIGLVAFIQYSEFTLLIPGLDVLTMPSTGGIAFVLMLMILSPLLGRFKFQASELIVIYVVTMLGGLVSSVGLVGYSVGNIASIVLLNMDNPSLYAPIYEQLSSLLVIKDEMAGFNFWIGTDEGVPWNLWIRPIVIWTIFWGAVFWVLLCMAVVVRKHWNDRERLVFPLVTAVVEVIRDTEKGSKDTIWNNMYYRCGLGVTALFFLPSILNIYFPVIPTPAWRIELGQYFTGEPWNAVNNWPGFPFVINPLAIGIGYLVSAELTLSIWVFYLLFKLPLQIGFSSVGMFPQFQLFSYEFGRAVFIGISLYSLYIIRHDIKAIIKKAFSVKSRDEGEHANEPMHYGLLFWGGLSALVFVVLFSVFILKIAPLAVATFLIIFFGVSLGFARLRAECGYPNSHPNMSHTIVFLHRGLGQDNLGTTTNFTLTNYYAPMNHGNFGGLLGVFLECYNFGDMAKIKRKTMTKIVVLTFFVAAILGYVFALPVIYEHGMFNLSHNRMYHARWSLAEANLLHMPDIWFSSYAIGIGTALVMMFLKTTFVWWPIHPLGVAIAPVGHINHLWASFFIAWLVKSVIMRYGGPRLLQKLRPFFFAIIVGTVIMRIIVFLSSLIVSFF